MILIALIGVAAAVLRTAPMRLIFALILVLIPPALLMTEIRAKRRRSRGRPMSDEERVVSVIKMMLVVLRILAVVILTLIAGAFLIR